MMDKVINVGKSRGLFMSTREDYLDKIERLARLITEQYPEIDISIDVAELHALYKTGSLNELVDFYDELYQKFKEYNIPSYRPHWMFKTKFYS